MRRSWELEIATKTQNTPGLQEMWPFPVMLDHFPFARSFLVTRSLGSSAPMKEKIRYITDGFQAAGIGVVQNTDEDQSARFLAVEPLEILWKVTAIGEPPPQFLRTSLDYHQLLPRFSGVG